MLSVLLVQRQDHGPGSRVLEHEPGPGPYMVFSDIHDTGASTQGAEQATCARAAMSAAEAPPMSAFASAATEISDTCRKSEPSRSREPSRCCASVKAHTIRAASRSGRSAADFLRTTVDILRKSASSQTPTRARALTMLAMSRARSSEASFACATRDMCRKRAPSRKVLLWRVEARANALTMVAMSCCASYEYALLARSFGLSCPGFRDASTVQQDRKARTDSKPRAARVRTPYSTTSSQNSPQAGQGSHEARLS